MQATPLVSVIIPVYNVEEYLPRCMDSVIGQTYDNLEVILVDDGSTDGSGDICEEYAQKDIRVSVIHKENGGLVSARKAGVVLANGKYVIYVDSDDWIERNMCEEMVTLAEQHNADIVTSGCIRDYDNHTVIENENMPAGYYQGAQLDEQLLGNLVETDYFFRSNLSVHCWNKLYKREVIVKYQMQVNNFINVLEDAAVVYPILLNVDSVVVSGKNYYHYCMRSNSIMGSYKKDEGERLETLFAYLEEEFVKHEERIPNVMKQFSVFKYYTLLLRQAHKVLEWRGDKLFPFADIKKNSKVIVYGAGRVGHEMRRTLLDIGGCDIVAWMDKVERENVLSINNVKELTFDKIIIAVILYDIATEIKRALLELGVEESKIEMLDCKRIIEKSECEEY